MANVPHNNAGVYGANALVSALKGADVDTEERLKIEDGIAASFLVGSTVNELYERLPACTWTRHLSKPERLAMARECAMAADVPALTQLVTAWRHAAGKRPADDVAANALPDPVGFTVDFEANTMYIHLAGPDARSARTVEVTPWMLVDFGENGEPVGVELLTLDLGAALRREV